MIASLLAALLLVGAPSADTTDTDRDIRVGVRPYPAAIYGPMAGIGFGAGVSIDHLGRTGSEFLLSAWTTEHRGEYRAAFATANPFTAKTYAILDTRYATNGRYWFHGVGPASPRDNRIAANLESADMRLRLGYRPGNGPLVIQPTIGLSRHTLHGFREDYRAIGRQLRGRSMESIGLASSVHGKYNWSNHRTGVIGGLQLAFDTRDRAHLATRGLLVELTGQRYESLDNLDLHFNRYDANTYAFLPLAPHHVLTARARLTITGSQSAVVGSTSTLPFYLLPRLGAHDVPGFDRHRYFDNDRLIFSLGYRFPLYRYRDIVIVSGEVAGHAANVYEDVSEQAAFAIDARETFSDDRATYPLQAAGSVGLYIAPLFRDDLFLETAVGLSADGVSAVQFKMVQSFRALRAAFL